jgi:excisionase family DNA binding protein
MDAVLPRLLTSNQVADWLNVTPRRVEDMARRGEIPSVAMPDGRRLFDAGDLATWLQGRKGAGAGPTPAR